jgi:hypothetical protein
MWYGRYRKKETLMISVKKPLERGHFKSEKNMGT